MPDGSFDVTYAHPFAELVRSQHAREDAIRLEQLRYHLKSNDYFAFLATIFGILEESLSTKPSEVVESELDLIHSIRKDLIFLQKDYRINPVHIEA
ncbi:MAG: hypothetical protein JWL82_277 [Parcubacteria group bacterium]|nr:hypothetical protein [Parcubacteria group bacterium]